MTRNVFNLIYEITSKYLYKEYINIKELLENLEFETNWNFGYTYIKYDNVYLHTYILDDRIDMDMKDEVLKIKNDVSEFLNNPNELLNKKIINSQDLDIIHEYLCIGILNYTSQSSHINMGDDINVQEIFNKSYLREIDDGVGNVITPTNSIEITILKHYKNEITEDIYFTTEGYIRKIMSESYIGMSEKQFLDIWNKYHENIKEFVE